MTPASNLALLFTASLCEADGWVTMNGTPVKLDGDGKIEKGPDDFVGLKPDQIKDVPKDPKAAKKERIERVRSDRKALIKKSSKVDKATREIKGVSTKSEDHKKSAEEHGKMAKEYRDLADRASKDGQKGLAKEAKANASYHEREKFEAEFRAEYPKYALADTTTMSAREQAENTAQGALKNVGNPYYVDRAIKTADVAVARAAEFVEMRALTQLYANDKIDPDENYFRGALNRQTHAEISRATSVAAKQDMSRSDAVKLYQDNRNEALKVLSRLNHPAQHEDSELDRHIEQAGQIRDRLVSARVHIERGNEKMINDEGGHAATSAASPVDPGYDKEKYEKALSVAHARHERTGLAIEARNLSNEVANKIADARAAKYAKLGWKNPAFVGMRTRGSGNRTGDLEFDGSAVDRAGPSGVKAPAEQPHWIRGVELESLCDPLMPLAEVLQLTDEQMEARSYLLQMEV
jgi:hypothetical protein